MIALKKVIIRACLVSVILIPVTAFAHFAAFPQETRSILICCSDFKEEGQVYFNAATPRTKVDSLKLLINQAALRVNKFWGQKITNPKFIYCDSEANFKKYSANLFAPAVTYLKTGPVIVLSNDAVNLDIIAHEISHAEFYERVGFFKFNNIIPSWFRHGLAMQNDYRSYYSEDTLRAKSDGFTRLPDIKNFKSDKQFYAGSKQQIMLNYMAAKHEVKNWYTKEKLSDFIRDLNSGKTFEEAFGR